jgi:lysophospholipase L1-like esterase
MKNRNNLAMKIATATVLITLMAFSFTKPKRLFLLGDSISLQYGTELQKILAGKFVIEHKMGDSIAFKNLDIPIGANGGDSRMVLKYLSTQVNNPAFKPDLFVLNCGLHDVKRDPLTNAIAVNEKDYRRNLEEIYALIARKKIPFIWIRTTGIIDSIHQKNKGFKRLNSDIKHYNEIADEVFSARKVPEIDLYSLTEMQGDKRFVDHAHFTPEVRKVQASFIAGFLSNWYVNQLN